MLGIEQAALAVSFVCAGAVLVLVTGTQILDWYWLLALALAGLAIGFVRLRKRALTRYAVAQALDASPIAGAIHIRRTTPVTRAAGTSTRPCPSSS